MQLHPPGVPDMFLVDIIQKNLGLVPWLSLRRAIWLPIHRILQRLQQCMPNGRRVRLDTIARPDRPV